MWRGRRRRGARVFILRMLRGEGSERVGDDRFDVIKHSKGRIDRYGSVVCSLSS